MMLDFGQKRKVRKLFYNRITLVALALLVILAVRSAWGVYQKKQESERMMLEAKEQLDVLKRREAELASRIERIKTPEGVEAEIRSKFNVARDDENVVVILDVATTTPPPPPKNWWGKMKEFFGF